MCVSDLSEGESVTCPANSVCEEGTLQASCQCEPGYSSKFSRRNGLSCECVYMYAGY